MQTLLHIIIIVASLGLIATILLQEGKQAGMSGAIGGGAEQIWGKNKAKSYESKLEKVTSGLAIVFLLSTLILTVVQ
ncbi:preprotein translocase subunit SecG [Gottschalkiaceae bacterium SANA]|nr:preprotein translocase subunit SecG [Gottschalkiaceae bacterium SANA]